MAIALGLLWVGYSVGYYGWNRITGGNNTFKQLIWPGAYTIVARDDGSGGASAGASSPAKSAASSPVAPSPTFTVGSGDKAQ